MNERIRGRMRESADGLRARLTAAERQQLHEEVLEEQHEKDEQTQEAIRARHEQSE